MNSFLKQSTASQSRAIGPFIDDTDFKTAKTGLTIANTDIKLVVNGGASANKNSGGGTHRINGVYGITFDATDTATVGEIELSVLVSGALQVFHKFTVLEEVVYDALFGASAIGYIANQPVDLNTIKTQTVTCAGGVTVPAATLASTANITAGTITTVTNLTNDPSGVTTLLARVGSWTGTGVNTVLGAFKAVLSKVASAPSDIGGTIDPTTDSLEAFKDAVATTAQIASATAAAIKLKKNTALSNYAFTIYLAGTRTPATGKTITCTKLLDADSAFTAMANSAAEVGTTGTYRINITTADINGDTGTWKFTASLCDPLIIHFVTQS